MFSEFFTFLHFSIYFNLNSETTKDQNLGSRKDQRKCGIFKKPEQSQKDVNILKNLEYLKC